MSLSVAEMREIETMTKEDLKNEREQRIAEYEKYIDEKLKADLKGILDYRDKLYDEIAKYLELRNKIQMLKDEEMKSMSTMIDLGSQFYVQAKVPDVSRMFVHVGLGFHVEFTHDEALNFIAAKEANLTKYTDQLTQTAAEVKARIKLMYHGISELMNLSNLTIKD